MKFDKETSDKLLELYKDGEGISVQEISTLLDRPVRSIVAKLSSLGVYKKKPYLNKRGETPVRKEELIEKIAVLLDKDISLFDSLEKCNKIVLLLLVEALES